MSFEEKNAALRAQIIEHFDSIPAEFGPEMNDWSQKLQGLVSKGSGIARKYRKRAERTKERRM